MHTIITLNNHFHFNPLNNIYSCDLLPFPLLSVGLPLMDGEAGGSVFLFSDLLPFPLLSVGLPLMDGEVGGSVSCPSWGHHFHF